MCHKLMIRINCVHVGPLSKRSLWQEEHRILIRRVRYETSTHLHTVASRSDMTRSISVKKPSSLFVSLVQIIEWLLRAIKVQQVFTQLCIIRCTTSSQKMTATVYRIISKRGSRPVHPPPRDAIALSMTGSTLRHH